MRTMLLSFKADVFERVLNGTKIYEHRRVFPDEPIKAYLYISSPVKAITGIMWLGNRKPIKDWITEYNYDTKAVERITNYLKYHTYAMEIQKFQPTNSISLDVLRNSDLDFVVPQMYYYLDDSKLLKFLEQNIIEQGNPILHDFSNIRSDQLCTH